MDLRSSPSQQHLNPSRSSSLDSRDERANELDPPTTIESRSHKLDLYSIPVFLLEVIVLAGLAYAAYYIHFEYQHEPLISGFYCDDTSYRHNYDRSDAKLAPQITGKQDIELTFLSMTLVLPVVVVIFCELVNSMFGSLKFRQIRALCTCCKLHSITRRTIRFSGAYLLGFLIVLISCDILANTTGRLRPHFAQECPSAYRSCFKTSNTPGRSQQPAAAQLPAASAQTSAAIDASTIQLASQPISSQFNANNTFANQQQAAPLVRGSNSALSAALERHWIDLTDSNLTQLCGFDVQDPDQVHRKAQSLAMSWPSGPASIFTYACLFLSCYLCFVGTARPFRIITSVIVVVLLLAATIFDVRLVRERYNHWDDVAAGSFLALVVVVFVLAVYLNKFKDTHYYENQKLYKRKFYVYENFKGSSSDAPLGQYNLDKTEPATAVNSNMRNGEIGGSVSNNDLAMRYFQIPRANYRGAPRPLTMNQLR